MSQLRRLVMWLRRGRLERELAEEVRLHIELRERELVAAGRAPDEARAEARRVFGNATAIREESRDEWGWRWLDELVQDLRFALRTMRRNPGFSLVAVLALALAIGANTAVSSVVHAVLLRPLPYADAGQLVTVLGDGHNPVPPANFHDYRDQARSFSAMGAAEYRRFNLAGIDRPEQVEALRLSSELLPLLGVPPLLGRWFSPEEETRGKEHVVILGHELWQARFGGDRAIVGKAIRLEGESYTVVGVMPPSFHFAPFWATHSKLYVPLSLGDDTSSRRRSSLRVFARLAPWATLADARAEMATITARLERDFPGTNRGITVTPLLEKVVGEVRPALLVLLGAVGLVLLVACANIAHMLLARAASRQREIALRTALGAGRGRLIRQLLTESSLLALLGGAAGLVLAWLGIDGLIALAPESLPRLGDIGIDGRVLAIMMVVALGAGVAFGLLPALAAATPDLHGALKEGAARATGNRHSGRLRGLLVASQMALALMLTVGAGLMVRSFMALRGVDPGFRPDGLTTMIVSIAGTRQAAEGRRGPFYDDLIRRAAAVPGVASVSAINHLPLAGDMWGMTLTIEGRPEARPGEEEGAVYRAVYPGYFRTMGMTLLRGRDLDDGDRLGSEPVVIVNQRLVERVFPHEDPLGRRLSVDESGPMRIVGVVADAAQHDWAEARDPEIFLAFRQVRGYVQGGGDHLSYITLVARVAPGGDPAALVGPLRGVVAALDPDAAVADVATMRKVIDDVTARPRFLLWIMAAFAGVALVLSAVGVYGVMSHAVARRTQEIGIRMALGATRGSVIRLIAAQGLGYALAGLGVGLVGAFALTRLMASLLYGVGPGDPVTFVIVPLALGAVAVVAGFVPARRAARVDPMLALRHD